MASHNIEEDRSLCPKTGMGSHEWCFMSKPKSCSICTQK